MTARPHPTSEPRVAGAGDAELELALLLCQVAARRAANRPRLLALLDVSSPDALVALLDGRRMLALLGRRLRDAAGAPLGEPLDTAITRAVSSGRAGAMALQHQSRAALHALSARGVRALELKGPGLAESAHGDLGARSSSDVDLLVAPEDLGAACDALVALGYELLDEALDAAGRPVLHRRLVAPGRARVEVHWRVHWHEEAFSRGVLDRARPGADGRLTPTPADAGACLLLFYARDGFYGARLLADVAGWWELQGAALGPGLLDAHVLRHPALARTWRAAALAADRHAGVPAEAWLSGPVRVGRREALALRLANPRQAGDPDQLAVNVMLVDLLLGPPGALRRLVRREADAAPGGRRAAHLGKVALRGAFGIWRVRRRDWT